ncbi:MAG: T9SS type A sorting domain-containing protein, partial [Flavobacteriales bacterium]|nr:T9SS type A sorting domain-containing protein [Flavobacteriales bacterium]
EVVSEVVNSNAAKLNLDKQPNGVYFVKVTANGVVTTQKVLLSK